MQLLILMVMVVMCAPVIIAIFAIIYYVFGINMLIMLPIILGVAFFLELLFPGKIIIAPESRQRPRRRRRY